jgi:hypothetical protein
MLTDAGREEMDAQRRLPGRQDVRRDAREEGLTQFLSLLVLLVQKYKYQ